MRQITNLGRVLLFYSKFNNIRIQLKNYKYLIVNLIPRY